MSNPQIARQSKSDYQQAKTKLLAFVQTNRLPNEVFDDPEDIYIEVRDRADSKTRFELDISLWLDDGAWDGVHFGLTIDGYTIYIDDFDYDNVDSFLEAVKSAFRASVELQIIRERGKVVRTTYTFTYPADTGLLPHIIKSKRGKSYWLFKKTRETRHLMPWL